MISRILIGLAVIAIASAAAAQAPQGQYRVAIVEITGRSSETLLLDCRAGHECSGLINVIIDDREETITITAKPESGQVRLWARHATRNIRLSQGDATIILVTRGEGGATVSLGEYPHPQRGPGPHAFAIPLVIYTPVTLAQFRVEVRDLGARAVP